MVNRPTISSQSASPLFRRLICTITLIVLVPTVSATIVSVLDHVGSLPPWTKSLANEHGFNGFVAALSVLSALLIWRSFVVWTMGRKTLTGTLALVPFIQVAIAQPMWNSGCGGDTVLCLAQEQVSIGAWVWLTVWVWWGLETAHAEHTGRRRRIMPANARCLIAAIGSIPFVFGVFWISYTAFNDYLTNPHPDEGVLAYAAAAVVAIPLWIIIWRRRVAWTPRVMIWTLASAVGLMVLPILVLLVLPSGEEPWQEFVTLPVIGWGLWMALTGCLWPYKLDIDVRPPSPFCLACGYALTGLTHTRCPECGDERTLDDLWNAPRESAI